MDHFADPFFLAQGIAVIELAQRYPGEGGVIYGPKEVFGISRFLSGWCIDETT